MSFKVERAVDWSQVEEAATICQRCIRPAGDAENAVAGSNWRKARETWETLGDKVVYFIVKETTYPATIVGYVRLFNASPPNYQGNPTWVVDYVWPLNAEVVVRVADELPGNVLVKKVFTGQVLTRRWLTLGMAVAVPAAPYRICSGMYTDWMVVVP